MTAELAVSETGKKRLSKDKRLFYFCKYGSTLRSFAAMELRRSDREPESRVIPCGRPCGDLCALVWEKRATDRPAPFLPCLWQFGADRS